MPTQRPFFLSTFLAAFRQQTPSSLPSASQQPPKHTTQPSASPSYNTNSSSAPRTISTATRSPSPGAQHVSTSNPRPNGGGVMNQLPLHSPRAHAGIPIPSAQAQAAAAAAAAGRRRGSDSSSEGFREVMGADKWYIGGRTAAGEEKFFRLGVVRRVRSGDRLSLDRLSL
jgi:hypothetical protein